MSKLSSPSDALPESPDAGLDTAAELSLWPHAAIAHIFGDGLMKAAEAEARRLHAASEHTSELTGGSRTRVLETIDGDPFVIPGDADDAIDTDEVIMGQLRNYLDNLRLLILRGDSRVCTTRTSVPGYDLYVTREGWRSVPVWFSLAFTPHVSDGSDAIRISIPKGAYEITGDGSFRLFCDYDRAWKGHIAVEPGRTIWTLDGSEASVYQGDLSNCTNEFSLPADAVVAVHGYPVDPYIEALNPTTLTDMLRGVPPALGQATYWQNPKYRLDGSLRAQQPVTQQSVSRATDPAAAFGMVDDLDNDRVSPFDALGLPRT